MEERQHLAVEACRSTQQEDNLDSQLQFFLLIKAICHWELAHPIGIILKCNVTEEDQTGLKGHAGIKLCTIPIMSMPDLI
jgi:hypothetical protein